MIFCLLHTLCSSPLSRGSSEHSTLVSSSGCTLSDSPSLLLLPGNLSEMQVRGDHSCTELNHSAALYPSCDGLRLPRNGLTCPPQPAALPSGFPCQLHPAKLGYLQNPGRARSMCKGYCFLSLFLCLINTSSSLRTWFWLNFLQEVVSDTSYHPQW